MTRTKQKYGKKEKKILIRVNPREKDAAERLSSLAGMNTSEFFRSLMRDYEAGKRLDKIYEAIETKLGIKA
jgi:predicted DNA binding CopG/RHH family protein